MLVRRWGTTGNGEGRFDFLRNAADPFSAIGGLAVSPDGSVSVTDTANDRIEQFTPDGTFVREWGGFGPGDGQFLEPFDIAVGPDGTLAVVDDRRDDIQTFTADGTWLATIGSHGAKPGQLANTGGVDMDAAGTILNADYDNQRIQAWDAARTYLWSQATATDGGPVSQPLDIAAAADGTLYVSDGAGIHILGADRSPLTTWTPPDAEGPDTPFTVAVAPDGTVFVASLVHDTIYRLTLGTQQVEATPRPSETARTDAPGSSRVRFSGSGDHDVQVPGWVPDPVHARSARAVVRRWDQPGLRRHEADPRPRLHAVVGHRVHPHQRIRRSVSRTRWPDITARSARAWTT